MTPQEIYADTAAVIHEYKSRLDKYSLQQFQHKPAPDRWSVGEAYTHIMQLDELDTVLNMQFK